MNTLCHTTIVVSLLRSRVWFHFEEKELNSRKFKKAAPNTCLIVLEATLQHWFV